MTGASRRVCSRNWRLAGDLNWRMRLVFAVGSLLFISENVSGLSPNFVGLVQLFLSGYMEFVEMFHGHWMVLTRISLGFCPSVLV